MREGRWSAVVILACFSLLSMNAAATVQTNSYPSETTVVYQWDDLVFSGVLEPDIETIGRVCSEDCAAGKKDPYDFWELNVPYGSSFRLDFESLHDPNYVNIDVDFCYSELSLSAMASGVAGVYGAGEITCRNWFDTDQLEADSSSPSKKSNVFGNIYIYVNSVPGWGGDDSRYSMNLDAGLTVEDEPSIIESSQFGSMTADTGYVFFLE
jgi:hypothetical protein